MDKKLNLFVPLESWSQIMVRLDNKIRLICQEYGWGKVSLEFTIAQGKVVDTSFNDEIKIRDMVRSGKNAIDSK